MENQLQFENLIDGLGPGCKNPMMYPAIRYYYCLGCDPMQPAYTNDATSEIRVCKSFVDRIWRDNGKEYDDCGVMKSNDVRLAPPFSPPLHLTTPSNVLWRGGSDQCRTSADWAWAWDADPWYQPGAGELPAGALHQQPQQSDDQADTARRQRWAHLIPGGAAVWAPSFRAPNEPEEPRGDGAGAGAGAVCCDKLLFGKGVTAAERAALAAMAAGEPGERAEEPAGPKEPLQWRGAGLAPVQV